jgi:hypothetical protein
MRAAAAAARRLQCPVAYVNQVGGNDELVFDGGSFVTSADGQVLRQLSFAEADLGLWDSRDATPAQEHHPALPATDELLLRALVLGVRDYARKCGFSKALLGLSGGIDSALVAVIATAALGRENVQALLMPSPWSSEGSIQDSLALADRLGIATHTVPIAPLMARRHRWARLVRLRPSLSKRSPTRCGSSFGASLKQRRGPMWQPEKGPAVAAATRASTAAHNSSSVSLAMCRQWFTRITPLLFGHVDYYDLSIFCLFDSFLASAFG